jgi:rhodanese-related sulfurtransferase
MRERGEDVLLLDVRTPREHAVARIEGAALVPLQQLPARVEELRPYADRPVVTVCHRGMRSLQAAAFLRQAGFRDVRSMAGGIDLWSRAVDPSVPRY